MPSDDIVIRSANPEDSPTILRHRRCMFEDMGEGTRQDLDRMIDATTPWLEHALADGSYRGWLAQKTGGHVVAGAGYWCRPGQRVLSTIARVGR
jgi:hypothetical protein